MMGQRSRQSECQSRNLRSISGRRKTALPQNARPGSEAQPKSRLMGTEIFTQKLNGRSVKLTIHIYSV